MSERFEGSVHANGIQIHYSRFTPPPRKTSPIRGRNRAPLSIVMLHSVTDNGMCWIRVVNALCKEYDLVLPDSRGHGFSDSPEMGYSVDDRAGDVAGLIQALSLDRPVLLGHSMGAETAIGTALLFPDLVRAVILEDPPWPGRFWGSTPEERADRAAQWGEDIRQQKELSTTELIAQARKQHPDWPEEELRPWAEAKQQVSPFVANLVHAPRRRWSDYVRQAQCPILLITADPERGAVVNEQTIKEAEMYWKNGRTVNIANAGHSIHREQFDPYMRAVKDFLSKVE
jgi:pimeloyl-ACP methyl ester carboxylesterase